MAYLLLEMDMPNYTIDKVYFLEKILFASFSNRYTSLTISFPPILQNKTPNVAAEWLAFLLRNRKVPALILSLCPETDYHDKTFRGLPRLP
jgi:hypothetical protein